MHRSKIFTNLKDNHSATPTRRPLKSKNRFNMKKIYCLLSLIPAITMFILTPITTQAQFSGGDGTENNPYIITTAEQLAQLASYVNTDNSSYNDKHYKLGNDLNLSGYQTGEGWIPIGSSYNFKGIFDGNNKKIIGLKINNTTLENVGLFGYLRTGTIKNLGIVETNIISSRAAGSNTGGVVGCNYDGNISNCYSTGSISSSSSIAYIGGVVGSNDNGNVSNCYSTSSISSSASSVSSIGGVAGYNNGNISNCYSTGSVSSFSSSSISSHYVGGVAGSNYGSISNCYSISLIASYYTYTNFLAGGIVSNSHNGIISSCVALNPSINIASSLAKLTNYRRIGVDLLTTTTFINNIAYKYMLNPEGNTTWNNIGANQTDGEDITAQSINADGTLGGRFTSANGWTIQNGKLPGLFGNTVDIPAHLKTPNIITETLFDGKVGTTYSHSLIADGITPITWTLSNGTLPIGLTLSTNGIISGTPTVAGIFNFTVKATNNSGNDTKALNILIEDGVGILESELSKITLYPNPAQTRLTVKRLESSKITVAIYNNLGTMVKTFETISDEINVDVSNFSSGLYFIQLFNGKSSTIKNFVKE